MKKEKLRLLVLMNNQIILSQIEEVSSDLGEPDCKLTEPFVVNQSTLELTPWLIDMTIQNEFMIHSDKILTIVEPNDRLVSKYDSLMK